jgi:hypothetical protein
MHSPEASLKPMHENGGGHPTSSEAPPPALPGEPTLTLERLAYPVRGNVFIHAEIEEVLQQQTPSP